MKRAYTDGPYGQIHYRKAGQNTEKPPLLCLHASPLSGAVYDNWLPEMGKDRLALAPDTPGYGESDPPPKPPTMPDYADAMIAFLDAHNIGQADVMGYHTGSVIAADMALRYPNRVGRVVMISATLFTQAELDQLMQEQGLDALPDTLPDLLKQNLDMYPIMTEFFRDMPSDERRDDMILETMRQFRINGWGFQAVFAYDLAATLKQLTQPVLVLNPEDDVWDFTPRAEPLLQNGTLRNLPGWTHGHLDKHTAEMAGMVRAFLDEPSS